MPKEVNLEKNKDPKVEDVLFSKNYITPSVKKTKRGGRGKRAKKRILLNVDIDLFNLTKKISGIKNISYSFMIRELLREEVYRNLDKMNFSFIERKKIDFLSSLHYN